MKLHRLCRQTLAAVTLICGLAGLNAAALAQQAELPININTATAEAIADALSGIGEKRAEAIVQWRQTHGDFNSLEDLGQIKGVGSKVLQKNRDRITFQ